jgi:NADH-quinone oxidoreductase subunit J
MALPKEFSKGAIQAPLSLKTSLSTSNTIDNTQANTELSNTERLGMVLYTDYFYAFEIAAVILLAAIIAAITLAHRAPISIKRQDIKKQIMTEKSSRLKLIKD